MGTRAGAVSNLFATLPKADAIEAQILQRTNKINEQFNDCLIVITFTLEYVTPHWCGQPLHDQNDTDIIKTGNCFTLLVSLSDAKTLIFWIRFTAIKETIGQCFAIISLKQENWSSSSTKSEMVAENQSLVGLLLLGSILMVNACVSFATEYSKVYKFGVTFNFQNNGYELIVHKIENCQGSVITIDPKSEVTLTEDCKVKSKSTVTTTGFKDAEVRFLAENCTFLSN